MKLAELADRLAAILYPHRCVLCGEVVEYDDMACGKCEFQRSDKEIFFRNEGLYSALAAMNYNGNVRQAVWRVKDRGDVRCVSFFAEEMAGAIGRFWSEIRFDCLMPVPTNSSRYASRGFNQAELLAERLSRHTGLAVKTDILIRREDSQTQHDLDAEQRRRNAKESYGLLNGGGMPCGTVLLVDDVLTTGATLSACAALLMEAGADRVYGLAATKTD